MILPTPLGIIIVMKRVRRFIQIAAPSLLGVLAALAIWGAFLGPEGAGTLLTSPPVGAVWIILGVGLAVAAVMDLRYRRFVLAAAHGGAALILIGSFLAGEQGHELLAQLGMKKIHRGVAHVSTRVNPDGTELLVSAHQSIEMLPITSQLVDYEPLADGPWVLAIERVRDGYREEVILDPWGRGPQEAGGITVIIDSMCPAAYDEGGFIVRPEFVVRVRRGENETQGRLAVRDPDRGIGVSLQELFVSEDDPTGRAGWLAAGGPWLTMDPPWGLYVRSARVALTAETYDERIDEIAVNRPMQYAGYQFFWTGYAGRDSVMLTVVSDTGWLLIQAGIVLLLVGMAGRCWVEPIWRSRRRRARS